MENNKIVSIVLGTYNRASFLKSTIKSIRENNITVQYEIIVIDGGSTDATLSWLTKQKDIILIVQHNRGKFKGKTIERKSWGYFMNLGFKIAKGKYILMVSDDCLLLPGSVMNGINYAEKQISEGRNLGAVAFYWRNWPEQVPYIVGLSFGKIFVNHGIYLKSALEKVNFLDEYNYKFYHADGDVCLRMWEAGYEVFDCPESYIEHFMHTSLKVRKNNLSTQEKDWSTYSTRWMPVYGNMNIDVHGRIERNHFDRNNTVSLFPLMQRLMINPKLKFGNLKSRILKIYRDNRKTKQFKMFS